MFSAVLFLPGELFQLSVRAVCMGIKLSSSALQPLSCRLGFLCLRLFLLHHFCFLSVYSLTPQPSTAIPPKQGLSFCFPEKTDVSCWPLSVQEGLMLHTESVRPLLLFFSLLKVPSLLANLRSSQRSPLLTHTGMKGQ